MRLFSFTQIKVIPSNPLYLAFYCFDAQYVLTILTRGYHFEKSKPILRFVGSVSSSNMYSMKQFRKQY